MNTRKLITAVVWIALASMAWSCNEDEPNIDPQTPSESTIVKDNLLGGTNVAMNRLRGQGFGGPMGAIFGNFSGSIAGRTNDSPLSMMKHNMQSNTPNDSTDTDGDNPSCLVETWEDDGNGNYSYTLDFGDGCEYYGEYLKGKFVEMGSYSETGFSSTTTYTEFGGEDWSIDGTQSYSGTWEESSTDDSNTVPEDSSYYYAANYEFSADLTQSYMEYEYDSTSDASTGEQLIEVDYVAQGSESVDESGYTVNSRSESVSFNTGETFTSNVDAPLYMSNACYEDNVWIFVSGIESGSYSFEGETGSYSINYGDGSCDNLVTVTENGVTEEVDLGELWEDWEEECGDKDHD